MYIIALSIGEKVPMGAFVQKIIQKKLAKKFGSLKERRTFAPAIEKTTQVVKRERERSLRIFT